MEAFDCAKYFIKMNPDDYPNTFCGNMKLQKMLYFAHVLHITMYDSPLFNNTIYAFDKGSVISDVRKQYKLNYCDLYQQATAYAADFSEDEYYALNTTISTFGGYDTNQLSEINHKFPSWIAAYARARNNGKSCHPYDPKSIISIADIKEDKAMMESLITSVPASTTVEHIYNGVKFFIDSSINVTDRIANILCEFARTAEDSAYTVYFDNGEMVVY